MNELKATPHGRLLSAAIALSLIGGGTAVLIGSSMAAIAASPICVAILCVSLLGSVALSLVAVAMSFETSPWFGFLSVILLPIALFLYWFGLQLAIEGQTRWSAYTLMALGVLAGVNALRGRSAAASADEPAHAH